MYKAAICDDNSRYLEITETAVRECFDKKNCGIWIRGFTDSDVLAEEIEEGKLYDIYILDIAMERYSGLELARLIRSRTSHGVILLLTAYRDYAVEACGLDVFRYLLKERLDEDLEPALHAALKCLEEQEREQPYVINNQRKYVKLRQRDIVYIYKYQKNVIFVMRSGREEKDRTTLQDAYKRLDQTMMYFLDRGTILNLRHVQRIADDQVIMADGRSIPSSSEHIAELKKHLHTYWGREG